MQEVFREEVPMVELTTKWWCRTFHSKMMRPVNGHYLCAECLRDWPVHWDLEVITAPAVNYSEIITTNAGLSVPHRLA
jgi:hypothetical protein